MHALEAIRVAIAVGDVSALVDEEGDELGVSVLARIEVQLLALLLQAPVFSHQPLPLAATCIAVSPATSVLCFFVEHKQPGFPYHPLVGTLPAGGRRGSQGS